MSKYQHEMYDYTEGKGEKPIFPKPWSTFTQDLKQISEELLVVHDTPDNMPKKACRMIDTRLGKKQAKGDCARGSLHQDTYYGAIKQDRDVKYVVRRTLDSTFKFSDVDKIVDEVVREKVKAAFVNNMLQLPVFMNEEKGIEIKKVRCYTPSVKTPLHIRHHRDASTKEYKQTFNVANDGNYCLAIYEGMVKGKTKREYEIVNNLDAAAYYKKSTDRNDYPAIVPEKSSKGYGYALKYLLKIGQMVLLYENSATEIDFKDVNDVSKRLYKIVGLSYLPVGTWYGTITLRHHSEARSAKDVQITKGAYKNTDPIRASVFLYHTQFKALVEGVDFEITPIGEIKLK